MIKLITGKKGTGKTKILIDMINDAIKASNGDLVCIEKGANVRRSISFKVRWCDVDEFAIEGFDAFYGFIAGICAGNYDITEIFIDATLKIGGRDLNAFAAMIEKLEKLTAENKVEMVFTVSCDRSELPESVLSYII